MATISELQKLVSDASQMLGHDDDPKLILLFLLEELGEVVRAYLSEVGEKPDNPRILETYKEEIGDVFFLLLRLANVRNIDLEAELKKTMTKLKKRKKVKT